MKKALFWIVVAILILGCTGQGSDPDVGEDKKTITAHDPEDEERANKIIPFPSDRIGKGGVKAATPEPLMRTPRRIEGSPPPAEGKEVYLNVRFDPHSDEDIVLTASVNINGVFQPVIEQNWWITKFYPAKTGDVFKAKVARNAAPGTVVCALIQVDANNKVYKHVISRSDNASENCEVELTVI